jgi:hypothetical protein
MKNLFKKLLFSITVLFAVTFSACILTEKSKTIGTNLTKGALSQLNLDSLAYNLAKNAELGLADSLAKRKFQLALDTLVASLGKSVKIQVDSLLKDTLINYKIRSIVINLRNELLSKKTSDQLQALIASVREAAIGAPTQKEIKALIAAIISQAGGDSTQIAVKRIKDILLGEDTKKQITSIIDTATSALAVQFNKKIVPTLDKQVTFISDKALLLVGAVTLALLLIIGFVWYKKMQQMKILSLISTEIHMMPNQQNYDELTTRIRQNALNKGLEGQLKNILIKQDMWGEEPWQKHLKKIGDIPR